MVRGAAFVRGRFVCANLSRRAGRSDSRTPTARTSISGKKAAWRPTAGPRHRFSGRSLPAAVSICHFAVGGSHIRLPRCARARRLFGGGAPGGGKGPWRGVGKLSEKHAHRRCRPQPPVMLDDLVGDVGSSGNSLFFVDVLAGRRPRQGGEHVPHSMTKSGRDTGFCSPPVASGEPALPRD